MAIPNDGMKAEAKKGLIGNVINFPSICSNKWDELANKTDFSLYFSKKNKY